MLLFVGVLIGLVLGLTGAGGSVFAVPLLIILGGFSGAQAVGLSLGAVAASTIYGSLRNSRRANILWVPTGILALSGVLTAPLGQWLGKQIPDLGLLMGFSLLAIVISVRMLLSARRNPDAARIVRAGNLTDRKSGGLLCRLSPTGQFELHPRCISGLLGGGLLVGLLSGLFGVGGGFLIVPLLLLLSQAAMAQTVASSLVIIAAISGAGFASHLWFSHQTNTVFDWNAFVWLVVGGVIGMIVGQAMSQRLANAVMQQVFAFSLVIISSVMIVRQLF